MPAKYLSVLFVLSVWYYCDNAFCACVCFVSVFSPSASITGTCCVRACCLSVGGSRCERLYFNFQIFIHTVQTFRASPTSKHITGPTIAASIGTMSVPFFCIQLHPQKDFRLLKAILLLFCFAFFSSGLTHPFFVTSCDRAVWSGDCCYIIKRCPGHRELSQRHTAANTCCLHVQIVPSTLTVCISSSFDFACFILSI